MISTYQSHVTLSQSVYPALDVDAFSPQVDRIKPIKSAADDDVAPFLQVLCAHT